MSRVTFKRKRMSVDQVRRIEWAIRHGLTDCEIARREGLANTTIRQVRLRKHSLQQPGDRKPGVMGYVPTPAEIEAACFSIRLLRAEGVDDDPDGWLPPGARIPLAVAR
ncbi:hypothetical protein [Botrimarina mediterranea]|uniref:hypothetical protein n=1 Tax=Botrimarina mediterranea TaxID=2528022 RepID=UPI00118918B4|nr:hypothetical protein K2D_05820 [Planctomycetes bacterium K2D]